MPRGLSRSSRRIVAERQCANSNDRLELESLIEIRTSKTAVTATGCRSVSSITDVFVDYLALSTAVVKFVIYQAYITLRGIIVYSDSGVLRSFVESTALVTWSTRRYRRLEADGPLCNPCIESTLLFCRKVNPRVN